MQEGCGEAGSRGFGELIPASRMASQAGSCALSDVRFDQDHSDYRSSPPGSKIWDIRPSQQWFPPSTTTHILANADGGVGYGCRIGAWNAMESLRSNPDIPATVGVVRLPPEI
jgi:hypothetical protein